MVLLVRVRVDIGYGREGGHGSEDTTTPPQCQGLKDG